jgi:hypothetical protein
MGVYRFSDADLAGRLNYASMKAGSIIPTTVSGGSQFVLGQYAYQAFTASGTLTIADAQLSCDALIVAGGGAGGQASSSGGRLGGGGGGGGLVYVENIILGIGSHTITVGAGGATIAGARGGNGTNSSLQGQTVAIGGGGGGGLSGITGADGGSGGGGANGANGGAGTAGQGFAGAYAELNFNGGGGGAAEAAGAKSTSNWSLNSIYGTAYGPGWGRAFTDWGLATNTGAKAAGQILYSSGGQGDDQNQTSRRPRFATPGGAVNSGNGGFGAYSNTAQAGSSGVVIIRFRKELVGL